MEKTILPVMKATMKKKKILMEEDLVKCFDNTGIRLGLIIVWVRGFKTYIISESVGLLCLNKLGEEKENFRMSLVERRLRAIFSRQSSSFKINMSYGFIPVTLKQVNFVISIPVRTIIDTLINPT